MLQNTRCNNVNLIVAWIWSGALLGTRGIGACVSSNGRRESAANALAINIPCGAARRHLQSPASSAASVKKESSLQVLINTSTAAGTSTSPEDNIPCRKTGVTLATHHLFLAMTLMALRSRAVVCASLLHFFNAC